MFVCMDQKFERERTYRNSESLPGWFPLKGRANCKEPELGLSFATEGYIGVNKTNKT